MFLDNKLFKRIEEKVKVFLKKEFTSTRLNTDVDARFLAEEFEEEMKNMQEFSSEDKEIAAARAGYIRYFKEYIQRSKLLFKKVNKTGDYEEEEDDVYEQLEKNTRRSDFIQIFHSIINVHSK